MANLDFGYDGEDECLKEIDSYFKQCDKAGHPKSNPTNIKVYLMKALMLEA